MRGRRASDTVAKVPEWAAPDAPHLEQPDDAPSRPSEREADAPAATRPGTADDVATLTARLDRLQRLVSELTTEVRLLKSDGKVFGRRVDTLADIAVTEPRQGRTVVPEAATTDARRPLPNGDAVEPVEMPSPDSEGYAASRKRIRVAILHCVAKLVEIGSPMSSRQLQDSLPKDVRVGTHVDLYMYLKSRAREGEVIRYAGGRSGTFEAGPGAAAYLDEHIRKPVVQLTELQVARNETEVMFRKALELLEEAGGGPLPVGSFVGALSGGTPEGAKKVKMLLKNCFYRPRTDDRGRGIGKVAAGHVLTRGPGDATGRPGERARVPSHVDG